jgi:hypothetical protein
MEVFIRNINVMKKHRLEIKIESEEYKRRFFELVNYGKQRPLTGTTSTMIGGKKS